MASTSDLARFDDYLTVGDAAKMLGVSPWTLRNWDNAGKLSSARHPVTGYRIYRPDDLQALLQDESLRGKQVRVMAPNLDWDEIGDTEHFVQFYEHDSFLIESVSKYIGRAINAGDGALIIATPNHRTRIRQKLKRQGVDVSAARTKGQLVVFDAANLLSKFMLGNVPDPTRFEDSIGSLVKQLTDHWPRVRAFGEMVALLWAEGNREGAAQLEALWNDLARQHSFGLLCAYPLDGFDDQDGPSLLDICDCHSRVIPAESYSGLADASEQLRTIASLQQKANRLQSEIDQRKAADRDRALLAAIVASSQDAIISKTFDGIIQTWNLGAERLFGYTECEAVGQSITLIIPPDRMSEEQEIIARLRNGERIEHYETVRVAKDGRRLDISLTISPLRDDNGNLIGASKVARDITERKQFDQAIRESEKRYRQLAELLPVGVYTCTTSGEISYFNKKAAELWGRTPTIGDLDERFCGSFRLFLPDGTYLPHDDCPMAVALREGSTFRNQEVLIERPDGVRLTALVNIDPIRDSAGNVIGAVNVFHDMSALKRTEQDLREQKENLQTLLETLPIAVFISEDCDCNRISGNRAAAEILRMPRNANFSKSAPDDERPAHFQVLREGRVIPPESLPMQRAARGEIVLHEEVDHAFDDGTVVHTLVFAKPLFNPEGEPRGAVACMLDMTDRKNAETALKEADRRKDEFLATLAHELRNPLAPLRNGLQLLQMSDSSGLPTDELHVMMERQVSHLVRLVDDLLEVSRISQGKIKLQRERISLATVIGHAVEACKPFIESVGHTLEFSMPDSSVMVDGDSVRLTQIFTNLLNNAAKYTNPGGTIFISSFCDGPNAFVSIRDTGIGIQRDMLSHVFDMFAQIDNPLRRSQDGLGIGLSLVQSLVAMHGGQVEARSDGLGHGSEFAVQLPRAIEVEAQATNKAYEGHCPSEVAAARRILVVDDNRDSADTLRSMLKILGSDVQTVYDGPSALEAIKICRPAVVLMDLGMPGMDGCEVARRIRQAPEYAELVLIAMTGWGQEEDKRRSREAGFDHHLVKPVDLKDLRALLAVSVS